MSKDEISDIKIIKAEIERINGHVKIFKEYGKTLDSIETALIGNSLNGHDGLVYKIDKLSKKVDEIDKIKTEFNIAKWVFGIIFVAVIGSLVRSQIETVDKEKNDNNITSNK